MNVSKKTYEEIKLALESDLSRLAEQFENDFIMECYGKVSSIEAEDDCYSEGFLMGFIELACASGLLPNDEVWDFNFIVEETKERRKLSASDVEYPF